MKKQILTLYYITIATILNSQAPTFKWARQLGGIQEDYGFSIAVDASGNVYTTGFYQGTSDFDPGTGTFNLTSSGYGDIFISKLDVNGNFIWAKSVGGILGDDGSSIAVDTKGNVYITGAFTDTVDFDPGIGTFNMYSSGDADIFILKLDASGNFAWVKRMGGPGHDEAFSSALDAKGNIYLTGNFQGIADFDPGQGILNLTSKGGADIFISKLDSNGNILWAKEIGGTSDDNSFGLKVDASGNVYTTGRFAGICDFDPNNGIYNLTSSGGTNIFVSKLDPSGNFIWAKNMRGNSNSTGFSIALDTAVNVYLAGSFRGTVDFDPGSGIYNLTSVGDMDIYISKLDSSGTFIWAKRIGSSSSSGGDVATSIAIDAASNVYTTGSFVFTADFDPGIDSFYLTATGGFDFFISKLDASGNFLWAGDFGGTQYNTGYSIAVDALGNIYTTGEFERITDFDPGTGIYNLESAGDFDIFVHKMGQPSVGIDKRSDNHNLNIFPNPTCGFFNIVFSDPSNNSRIEIYNSLGEIIFKQAAINETNTIDLTNYPNGLYFVKVIDDENKIATGRIVKSK